MKDVSVAINGTLEGKYRAGYMIIEQIEIFRGTVSIIELLTNLVELICTRKSKIIKPSLIIRTKIY